MSMEIGQQLRIRSMIYVAAEPVPYFWPMRAFIHHNPLHGLENMPFSAAVNKGARLFHGQGFLPRTEYQSYLQQGKVDARHLEKEIDGFLESFQPVASLDVKAILTELMTRVESPVMLPITLPSDADIQAALSGGAINADALSTNEQLEQRLHESLLTGGRPLYEVVDSLYGTEIGTSLDELVIKSCLDFFDEGQSVWRMPNREQGFFTAWRQVAKRNIRLFLRGLHIQEILDVDETPEGIIAYVMKTLQIPEQQWIDYFTHELARLHGWAGFIRWRSSAKHYHWARTYPGDLVDYLAMRLTLALALLSERGRKHVVYTYDDINRLIHERTREMYLRHEFHGGAVLPAMAQRVEMALASGGDRGIDKVFSEYVKLKRRDEAQRQASQLVQHLSTAGQKGLSQLSAQEFSRLLAILREFEKQEPMFWLRAMESHAMQYLLQGISLQPTEVREKRPFAQALFCIDTRSERIRRQLEGIGDYQTFGIAGFFGVPVNFMELGKGSETHLCPVILTPKNVVLEMNMQGDQEHVRHSVMEKAIHSLKESVLTPFVTVEAIGLLFGFDMVGKTMAPRAYNRWRHRLDPQKPVTRLLLNKLTREQADSIVRAVQRAVIVKAVETELGLEAERLKDELIRDLREAAMGHVDSHLLHADTLGVSEERLESFIERLREGYRINPAFAQLQMEQLGRIGFALDEQVRFVSTALKSIGLTDNFSRFILLVGHGSSSENNPYESALDCGACGGNHGLVSARVLAQMANKPDVRQRLKESGIHIPDDAWFIPALHNTTTDEVSVFDLDLLPSSHLIYIDRLRKGLTAASRLCAQERAPTLQLDHAGQDDAASSQRYVQRNATDWSQVRPEWGLSGNAYFIIGSRNLTRQLSLEGRAFLHSYNYQVDRRRLLLENILTGPLVVGQWINMEHYFSSVDNERFGSGSKVYHNVAGRFGVMTGNLSDLRTGLPAQTVLESGKPYHQPLRLITVIEAPFQHAVRAVEDVVVVKNLVRNGWIRLMIVDPETSDVFIYEDGDWHKQACVNGASPVMPKEASAS